MPNVIKYFRKKIFKKENLPNVIGATLVTTVAIVLTTYLPFLVGSIVEPTPTIPILEIPLTTFGAIALYASTLAISTLLPTIREMILNPVISRVTHNTWEEFSQKMITQPHAYQVSTPQGTKVDLGVSARTYTTEFATLSLNNIIPSFLEIGSAMGVFFGIHGTPLGLIVLGATSSSMIFNIAASRWTTDSQNKYIKDRAIVGRFNFELWKNFEIVYYFNTLLRELAKLRKITQNSQDSDISNLTRQKIIALCTGLINQGFFLGAVLYSGNKYVNKEYTLAQFFSIVYFLRQLIAPLNNLCESTNKIAAAYRELVPVLELFDKSFVDIATNELPPIRQPSGVVFDNVFFQYDKAPVLKGVSFTAEPGKTTALVGASGGGKTTVARILYRFYAPTTGKVTIDGHDISTIRMSSLSNNLSIVPQNHVIFNSTLRENLEYGALAAPALEGTLDTIKRVGLSKFVDSYDDGLNKRVGEGMLSGGQLQRIAIARAVIRNASVYILDEYTSALDADAERYVQQALNELLKDKVRIVISHRLSTIKDADKIVVLHDGRADEQGTFNELLQLNKNFKRMWDRQQSSLGEELEQGLKAKALQGSDLKEDLKVAVEQDSRTGVQQNPTREPLLAQYKSGSDNKSNQERSSLDTAINVKPTSKRKCSIM